MFSISAGINPPLPVLDKASHGTAPPRPQPPATILVVDDIFANRELLREILTDRGYEVILAANGHEARQHLQNVEPSLVLLDIRMPEGSGIELCRELKSNSATRLIPVVLLTSLSEVKDRVEGWHAGADDFISKPFDRTELLARVRSLVNAKAYTDELERAETVLFALARAIEGKDPGTAGHCERLSHLAVALGRRCCLDDAQLVALHRAGIVHDIGKVAIPEAVLLKEGPLAEQERLLMEQHPAIGEAICRPLRSFGLVLPLIRHHHEKLDGSGYPDRLRGDEISLPVRIVQMVDVFDALTTDRPYHAGLSRHQALETMAVEVKRGWRDRDLFETFRQLLRSEAP
jgi:putative two-component system response regulator